jgi:EpsI family protein
MRASHVAVALLFLGLNLYAYHRFATEAVVPPRLPFASFPNSLGDWRCEKRATISAEVRENLGASDVLLCSFVRDDPRDQVDVYIGYHETQIRREGGGGGENSIHPPEHCIPGSGWDIIDLALVTPPFEGLPGDSPTAKRAVIAHSDERGLTYFWFQSRGRALARNHEVILYRMLDRATRNRTDGALVRFTVPVIDGDMERAETAVSDLANRVVPLLGDYVPL